MGSIGYTLDPVQAGRVLGVGRNTAYRLIHDGTIPAIRLGKKLRVPCAALHELLRAAQRKEML